MKARKKLSKRQYVEYFNYNIRFTRSVREYLSKYIIREGEILDTRPIMFCFTKHNNGISYIEIKYYLLKEIYNDDDMGDRLISVPLDEFEEKMGWQ